MKLRDYQWAAVKAIWDYFLTNSGNPLVALPTGTGKSLVIAGFVRLVQEQYPATRIMCLTHVKELVEQNCNKLMEFWPESDPGIYSAALNRRDVYNRTIFAGIASVGKKPEAFGHIDLIIIDEAHLLSPNENTLYQKFIAELKKYNPRLKVIGLTATPWRMGFGMLTEEGSLFTDVCFDMTGVESFNWFVCEGYLIPLTPRPTNIQLDVEGVHTRGGEFIPKELQLAVDRDDITEAALHEALEVASERHCWMIFCAGVEHAENTAAIANMLGIPCGCVHGKMSPAERDSEIAKFKAGQYRAITNNNILTTGFDHPAIDLIVMLRPTQSAGLWVQMLGRGTRPVYIAGFDLGTTEGRLAAISASHKQDCMVLDYAGNTMRLGPINDPRVPRKKGKKTGPPPVKLCERCDTYNHASARFCINPACQAEFVFETKITAIASDENLVKQDLPIVEVFKVDHITYYEHTKKGAPNMIRVTYYSGIRKFDEYVCLEHTGYALKRARDWWRARSDLPVPEQTADALAVVTKLKTATHLRVWTNKKHPQILAYDFENSAFGTLEADPFERPTVENASPYDMKIAPKPEPHKSLTTEKFVWKAAEGVQHAQVQWNAPQFPDVEDDIPF